MKDTQKTNFRDSETVHVDFQALVKSINGHKLKDSAKGFPGGCHMLKKTTSSNCQVTIVHRHLGFKEKLLGNNSEDSIYIG